MKKPFASRMTVTEETCMYEEHMLMRSVRPGCITFYIPQLLKILYMQTLTAGVHPRDMEV